MVHPHENNIKSLHHVSKVLEESHQDLNQARSIEEIHKVANDLRKLTSGVDFKRLIHELGHGGHELLLAIEKAEENTHKAHRVSDSKKCLILVEAAQHAVREELHKLEGHGTHGHSQHHR